MPVISITTDFGDRDGYVGTMKGVMAGIAPGATFADITQLIEPQNVRQAAYVLWTALPYFPRDSVHLVVVDPGVGTVRRPIAADTAWGRLVGPDNGVFSLVWAEAPPSLVVELANPAYHREGAISHTFHGRDIFSPAAAHIAAGVSLEELGPVVENPIWFPTPVFDFSPGKLQGEILYIDHFGNAITNIGRLTWVTPIALYLEPVLSGGRPFVVKPAEVVVSVGNRNLGPIRHTYGEVSFGESLALVGSEGMLELAVNQGHGANTMDLHIGDAVIIEGDISRTQV